jgi:transcriptional/translational regulatory protein YebC/TACO1
MRCAAVCRRAAMAAGHSRWANIVHRQEALARRQQQAGDAPAPSGLETVCYEGYGPGGAAVLVECLTAADGSQARAAVRRTFAQHGGHLGAAGSVRYLFNTVGVLGYPPGADARQLLRAALAAGAEDVVTNADRSVEVLADPLEFATVRARLTQQGVAPVTAEVTWRAAIALQLSGELAREMLQLLQALEQLAEVRAVYSNAELPDDVLLGS